MNENALATLSPHVRTMAHRTIIALQLILYLVVADDINLTLASVGVLLSMAMTIYLFMNMDDNPTSDGPFLGIMVVAFHVLASIGGAFLYSGLMWSISRFYGILALVLGIYVVSVFMTHRSQILASEPSGADLKSFVKKRSVALKSLAVPALTLLIGSIITQRYKALLLAEFDGLMAGKYFFAYWMLLPLVLTILSVVYVMKYELNKSTPVELSDTPEFVDESTMDVQLARMDERLTAFEEKWINNVDESVDQTVVELRDLPKKRFATKDEQREYLLTIQEKLQRRLNQDFGSTMTEEQLETLVGVYDKYMYWSMVKADELGEWSWVHRYGFMKTWFSERMDPWMNRYIANIKPFTDYAVARLYSDDFQALADEVDARKQGYRLLVNEMALLDDRSHVLTQVRVNEQGVVIESDVVVVSQYGVFVINAFHRSAGDPEAYVLEISKEGYWSKVWMDGLNQKTKPVSNLSAETNRQALVLQKRLNRVLKEKKLLDENRYIDVTGVVAVTSPELALDNESDNAIWYLAYVHGFVHKHGSIYTPEEVDGIVAEITAHSDTVIESPYETIDYEAEYEQYADFIQPKIPMIQEMEALFNQKTMDDTTTIE